ncbi:MAG: phosphodiester glycosidase family protein [Clostridia bacterium]|nr:phosphodiester glycosidase family protein [Clostridia bacterium]
MRTGATAKKGKNTEKETLNRKISKILLSFMTAILILAVFLFSALGLVCYGPSPAARDLFVMTVMETSAAKFLAKLYFSEEKIESIIKTNCAVQEYLLTDSDRITLKINDKDFDPSAIVVKDLSGKTFVGKMMTVNDPSRLSVYHIDYFDENTSGEYLTDIVTKTGATAAINGGAFLDEDGLGLGGMPQGIIISNGKVVCDNPTSYPVVIGFNEEHKLIIGKMNAKEALALGIQEAITFGPALVVNGERAPISGNGGGLNPRSAIGQTEDGRILLVTIDGRSPSSLGASYNDLADIMLEHGAINAANLDGGSSSMLLYKGEILNSPAMFTGTRPMPSAILVR